MKNKWKYTFEISFTNFIFILAANAFCMGSHWFVYITGTPESISNPTNFFFWIWWFFSWAVFCHRLFWNTGFVHVQLRSFVKSDKDSSTKVSLSWVPWFSSSVYKFRLWYFYNWTCFIFKICFELFEFTWYLM